MLKLVNSLQICRTNEYITDPEMHSILTSGIEDNAP